MEYDSEAFDRTFNELQPKVLAVLPDWAKREFLRDIKRQDYHSALETVDKIMDKTAHWFAESCKSLEATAHTNYSFGKGARRKLRRYIAISTIRDELSQFLGNNWQIVSARNRAYIKGNR